MIFRGDMFEPLLEVYPAFSPLWDEFLADWAQEREKPQYLALADLARHMISKLEAKDTAGFAAVFGVVERWIVEGEHYVSEAAVVGFLENLQNKKLYTAADPQSFVPWLKPRSLHFWHKVEAFWRDNTPITDD